VEETRRRRRRLRASLETVASVWQSPLSLGVLLSELLRDKHKSDKFIVKEKKGLKEKERKRKERKKACGAQ
jgi:hypothetical protein